MADHPEDNPLENKAQEPEKPANEACDTDNHTSELDGIKDFVMKGDEKTESDIELMGMPNEEESSGIYNRIEDVAEQLDNLENSPNDESSMFTAPGKKIKLTEADYADVPDMEDVQPTEPDTPSSEEALEIGDKMADNIPEIISESGDSVNLQITEKVVEEAQTFQDEPKIPASNEIPGTGPAETPPASSTPRPRTVMATALGLLGIMGASGALWMNVTLTDRVARLETQPPGNQEAATIPGQSEEIALLARRLNTLETTVSSLMKDISKQAPAVAAQTDSSDLPVIPAAPVKPVIADAKMPSGNHQGIWVINLVSLNNAAAAVHELERMKGLGIPAENVKAEIRGKTWYRIRVPGFASAKEANRQRKLLATKLGIQDTWIGKR